MHHQVGRHIIPVISFPIDYHQTTSRLSPAMKLSTTLVLLWASSALGQAQTCTREMIATDDCAAVIDANACYNQFRWNAQTLQCIDGTDNADRQRKARTPLAKRASYLT